MISWLSISISKRRGTKRSTARFVPTGFLNWPPKKLNLALSLPHDITLRTKDCKEINAFYDPADRSVTMCYELMEHFYRTFKSAGETDDKAYAKMSDAVRFVFLHEIAHALIDQYASADRR